MRTRSPAQRALERSYVSQVTSSDKNTGACVPERIRVFTGNLATKVHPPRRAIRRIRRFGLRAVGSTPEIPFAQIFGSSEVGVHRQFGLIGLVLAGGIAATYAQAGGPAVEGLVNDPAVKAALTAVKT